MDIKNIRNIGIIAHIDAGKTTTTEEILHYTGRTYRIGKVDDGTTITDYLKEERERGITITSACVSCHWREKLINIIDTPGHVDFTVEVERSLRVLDGAVVIFSAVEGVESQSETVWHQADRYNIPRIAYINKIDRIGADPYEACKMMRERLSATPLILQIPYGTEGDFKGIIDLLRWKSYIRKGDEYIVKDIPSSLKKRALEEKEKLLETISLHNDHIAEIFLEGGEPSLDDLLLAIREGTIKNHYSPTFFGASLKSIGIQPLLDGIVDFLPSPRDLPPITGKTPDGKEIHRKNSPNEPFSALVFKIAQDPFGKLSYTRVYSGGIKSGSSVLDATSGKMERITKIFLMYAQKRENVREIKAGSICAIVGPKETKTGDTLCAREHPILLESPDFAQPVVSASIEPKTRADEAKLLSTLKVLEEEDPTFSSKTNEETGEIIISGMGELHLDVLTGRIVKDYGVQVRVGKPRVSYRETINGEAEAEGKYIRQTGGRGHYGHIKLKVFSIKEGMVIENNIKGGELPMEFLPAVKEGIIETLNGGVYLGFPVVNIKVVLKEASYHRVDSSPIDYKIAAGMATREAIERAAPCLLEPMMRLEVIVPGEYLGAILEDLSARSGKITTLQGKANLQVVTATCPLRNMFGYATAMRSLSQGRAVHMMEFGYYGRVPKDDEREIVERLGGFFS